MRRAISLTIAAVVAAACGDSFTQPEALQDDAIRQPSLAVGQKPTTWAMLTPVPSAFTGVEGMSVGSVGNRIIAALGNDGGDTDLTRIYDISKDSWSLGATAPGTSSEGAGVAHDGLFYNIGGRGAGFNALWSYEPSTDTWTTLAAMPTGRAGLAAAVVGDFIYAIGGRANTGGPCSGAELATVERYDILGGTWSTVASLPSPRSDASAARIGGKVYVFGGCQGTGVILADVDVYDPETDTWSTAPMDMPTARAGMYAVGTKGGTVYVIGGWDGIFPFNPAIGSLVEAYKVSQDAWTTGLPSMPTPRAETGAVSHNGKVYIVGGAQPGFGSSVNAHEAFKP